MYRQSEMGDDPCFFINKTPQVVGEPSGDVVRLPNLTVDTKLQENRERRMAIEKQRMKERKEIMEKRKEKEGNIQRILKQRQEAKQSGRILVGLSSKTSTREKFHFNWKKAEEIDKKIERSRERAGEYRTSYQKRLHQEMVTRESNARKRMGAKENETIQRSLNYHLAEWNQYGKKIAEKYRGQTINDKRLYETYFRKEDGIRKQLKELHYRKRQEEEEEGTMGLEPREKGKEKGSHKERGSHKEKASDTQQSKAVVEKNIVVGTVDLSLFGLQKSIRSPEKIMKSLLQFIENRVGPQDPTQDQDLLQQLQRLLDKDTQF